MVARNNEIWTTYLAGQENAKRQELVLKYLPLVKYHVNRLAVRPPKYLDQEDLVSYGIIGLMEAVERYDPTRGVNFESYASRRIRGAILDALRQAHWAPRTLIDKLRQVNQVYRRLEQEQDGEVSETAVAAEVGITVEELQELLERGYQMAVLSLEDYLLSHDSEGKTLRGETITDPHSPDPVAKHEQDELRQALIEGLQKLNEKDRLVLNLYYYEGLTLKEIGKVLKVSESRVCQLHGRALVNLRKFLIEYI